VTSPLKLTNSNFIFQLNTCGYSPYVTSSLTRGGVCHLQLLLVLASAVILRSESRGMVTFPVSDSSLPQPGGSGPRIYTPQEKGGLVITQALGSLFVALYGSQGYGGGIRLRLHTRVTG
jgi:hypothetical protein